MLYFDRITFDEGSGSFRDGYCRNFIGRDIAAPRYISENQVQEETQLTKYTGRLEKKFATWNHLNIYYNIGITGYYVLQPFSSIASLEQTIYAALSLVVHQHPILSVIIANISTPCPSFDNLPYFDLQNVVSIIDRQRPYPSGDGRDVELDELLETPHNESFENDANDVPFWRLLILRNPVQGGDHTFTASFVYHPAIADGISGLVFHKHFLAALNSSPKPLRSAITQTPKIPLLPELEKHCSFPVSFSRLVKAFFEDKFSSLPRGIWAGAPASMKGQRRFRSATLSPSITSDFTAACQSNGTTLQATIQVLAAESLFSILPNKFKRVDCNIVVSLRGLLDELAVKESMGALSSSTLDQYDRSMFETDGFRWNEAHRSRDVIAVYHELKGKDDMVGLLKYVKNYKKQCWSKVGRPRVAGFEINNAGIFEEDRSVEISDRIDEEETEEWKVGRMVFSQSAGVLSAAVMISIVIGGDGGLTLGYAWQKGAVDKTIVVKLMEKMQVGVKKLARSE